MKYLIYLCAPGVCAAHILTCFWDEYISTNINFMLIFYMLSILFTILLIWGTILFWSWWSVLFFFTIPTICGINFIHNCLHKDN